MRADAIASGGAGCLLMTAGWSRGPNLNTAKLTDQNRSTDLARDMSSHAVSLAGAGLPLWPRPVRELRRPQVFSRRWLSNSPTEGKDHDWHEPQTPAERRKQALKNAPKWPKRLPPEVRRQIPSVIKTQSIAELLFFGVLAASVACGFAALSAASRPQKPQRGASDSQWS